MEEVLVTCARGGGDVGEGGGDVGEGGGGGESGGGGHLHGPPGALLLHHVHEVPDHRLGLELGGVTGQGLHPRLGGKVQEEVQEQVQ